MNRPLSDKQAIMTPLTLVSIITHILNHYVFSAYSLSRLRILLTLVLLYDWITRILEFGAFYSEQGILPLQFALQYRPTGSWSLYFLSSHDALNLCLWGMHGLLLFILLIGWRTAIVTPLVWIFTYSMQQRNPFINQGGDNLALLVLACAIFLPWGAHYSIDERKKYPTFNLTIAHVWLTLVIASMYIFSVLLKSSNEWRVDGSAIEKVLQIHQLRSNLGAMLQENTNLNQMLSWIVYGIELLIPCFLLVPIGGIKSKRAAMWLMLILHLGVALFLTVGIFPWVNLAIALAFLYPLPHSAIAVNSNKMVNAIILLFITISLTINLATLPRFGYQLIPSLQKVAYSFGLVQHWGMFSPEVIRNDGWFSAKVLLANGDYKDFEFGLNTNYINQKKLSDRWRKFSENMQKPGQSFLSSAYCYFLLRHYYRQTGHKSNLLLLYFNEVVYDNNGQYKVKPAQVISACHE